MFYEILNNFHIFVLTSTLVYYILLRFYKRSVVNQTKTDGESSNLIYVLFVPVLLYLTKFLFFNTSQVISNNYYTASAPSQQFSKIDRFIRSPYPSSTVSSASVSI